MSERWRQYDIKYLEIKYHQQIAGKLPANKYHQLDADGKRIIDEQVDFQLFKQQQNVEKEEENLG